MKQLPLQLEISGQIMDASINWIDEINQLKDKPNLFASCLVDFFNGIDLSEVDLNGLELTLINDSLKDFQTRFFNKKIEFHNFLKSQPCQE